MTFDHEYNDKDNVIEAYLHGKLSADDESAFEEHLLTCEICRNKLLRTEKVIDGLEDFAEEFSDQKIPTARKLKIPSTRILFRIAAVFFLAALIPGLYFSIKNASRMSGSKVANNYKTRQPEPSAVIDSAIEIHKHKTDNKAKEPQMGNKSGLSKDTSFQYLAYEPSPVFENAIGDMVRSSKVSVRTPAISDVFKKNDTIVFYWTIPDRSSAWLAIKNNRGTTLIKEYVSPPVRRHLDNAGLYYWQLITDDDVIYTGKIIVNE